MPRRKGDDGKRPGVGKSGRNRKRTREVGAAEAKLKAKAKAEADAAVSQIEKIMGSLAGEITFDIAALRKHGVTQGDAAVAWALFVSTTAKMYADGEIAGDKALTAMGQGTRIAVRLAEMNEAGNHVSKVEVVYNADAIMPAGKTPDTVDSGTWTRSAVTGDEIEVH